MERINITGKTLPKIPQGFIAEALGAESMDAKTEIEGIFVSGRHLGPNQFRGTNIEKSFHAYEDGVTIRLDDISIPEWWQEIHITKATLKRMLNEIENSKEAEDN